MENSKQLCKLLGIKPTYTYRVADGNYAYSKKELIELYKKGIKTKVSFVHKREVDFTNPVNFVKLLEVFVSVNNKFKKQEMLLVMTENLIQDTLSEMLIALPQSDKDMIDELKQQMQAEDWEM